ncbi:hypothetical protein BGY98DRAFT_688436 [Russula aff. rugulosa BPL654]|nr:hypothetical protein BGY98DRAFT_688436 [Russula aff. rugulosa BPL654]
MGDNLAFPYNQRQTVTIDVFPDDVLLAIFGFLVVGYQDLLIGVMLSGQGVASQLQSWQSLVHVCRRWRGLIFASPRHLNLQLFCKPGISARKTLDVWPALPLLIEGDVSEMSVGNIIAELEHNDRILQIYLDCHPTSQFERLWTAMQFFPIHSWVDLRHVFDTSTWMPFNF